MCWYYIDKKTLKLFRVVQHNKCVSSSLCFFILLVFCAATTQWLLDCMPRDCGVSGVRWRSFSVSATTTMMMMTTTMLMVVELIKYTLSSPSNSRARVCVCVCVVCVSETDIRYYTLISILYSIARSAYMCLDTRGRVQFNEWMKIIIIILNIYRYICTGITTAEATKTSTSRKRRRGGEKKKKSFFLFRASTETSTQFIIIHLRIQALHFLKILFDFFFRFLLLLSFLFHRIVRAPCTSVWTYKRRISPYNNLVMIIIICLTYTYIAGIRHSRALTHSHRQTYCVCVIVIWSLAGYTRLR